MGVLMIIIWIVGGLLCFFAYHTIFDVVYFNLGKGCVTELAWSFIGGYILAYLFTKHLIIALVVTTILLLIVFGARKR